MRIRRIVLALLVVGGCGGGWEEVSFVDEGELCLGEADGAVVVEVSAPDCLSSGCSRNVEASCTATVLGTEIRISSDISWEEKTGRLARCDADCGIATATCTVGTLADGPYTVAFDEGIREIQIQSGVPLEADCPL